MTSFKLPAIVSATVLVLTAAAQAADMPQLPLPAKVPVQEFYSPWYVRIDGGYRVNDISGGKIFGLPYSSSTLADSATIGGGVGFQWNWYRTDITVDYGSQPKFEGFIGGPAAVTTAKLTSFTTLWNSYIDMGTWWGVTPYVGAGIGFSYLKPADFNLNPPTLFATQNDPRWDFSWAAMAGLGYSISPGLLFDVNYRFLDIGRARTNVPALGEVTFGDWTAHEFRLGLRYLIQ